MTSRLTPVFIKCISLTSNSDGISALALCTLLLPDEHLRVLKYFTKFVNEVANHSLESKMTLSNLAIVFAPNLMSTVSKDKTSEKSMKEITHVVNLLFKNFHLIGMVPDILFEKARNVNNDGGFCSSSGDELESDFGNDRYGRTLARSDKRRDRSKSIKGLTFFLLIHLVLGIISNLYNFTNLGSKFLCTHIFPVAEFPSDSECQKSCFEFDIL